MNHDIAQTHAESVAETAVSPAVRTVAEAFLAALKARGIDYFYIGAGTDTAPIVEAYARQEESGLDFPVPVISGHENVAISMAHGYYMVSGKPQAVMLHVSVGTANAVCGLMNAARSQVPMFFTAGRTPLFESGVHGARDNTIHWGQEMFDQAAMVREFVKWDYELRDGSNVAGVVDRALSISMAHPRGPIYLTLPREVLASPLHANPDEPHCQPPSAPHPDREAVRALAQVLANAEFPVVISTSSGADPETVGLLATLAEKFGIGVVEYRPRYVNFPSSHPLHLGFEAAPVFPHADALLLLESDVPWIPKQGGPHADCFVAQAGVDPLFARYPLRTFPSRLSITGQAAALLKALICELETGNYICAWQERAERLKAFAARQRAALMARVQADEEHGGPITKLFLSRCINEVMADDITIVNEYSVVREILGLDRPGSFFHHPVAGGLGWGMPAALGAQQADRGRVVMSVLGDGAYLFCNPAACHQAAAMHGLPILTIVYDNGGWDAVEKSALAMYPDAYTAAYTKIHAAAPLASLEPVPEFSMYAQASGGHGQKVESRAELLPALKRALEVVRTEGRQALLHVRGV